MTYTRCTSCRRRIPWGEARYMEIRGATVVRETCFGCVKKTRGRTGSTPGDTAPTTPAQVHAEGDSGGSGVDGPLKRVVAPERQLHVPDIDELRVGKGGG
jgi:hypothetical protein